MHFCTIYLFIKNALMHISETAIYFLNELYTMDMFPSQWIDLIHFNIACFFVKEGTLNIITF